MENGGPFHSIAHNIAPMKRSEWQVIIGLIFGRCLAQMTLSGHPTHPAIGRSVVNPLAPFQPGILAPVLMMGLLIQYIAHGRCPLLLAQTENPVALLPDEAVVTLALLIDIM